MTNRRNKLGLAVCAAMFSVALTACGGGGGGGGGAPAGDEWNAVVLDTIDRVHMYLDPGDPEEGCEVTDSTLVIHGDYYGDDTHAYIYGDTELLGAWPGTQAERLDTCNQPVYTVDLSAQAGFDPAGDYKVIANNNNNDKQTGDGNVFSADTLCLKMTDDHTGTMVTGRECGVSVPGQVITDSAYIFDSVSGKILRDGDTIEINEVSGNPDTGYADISLLMSGAGVNDQSEGTFGIGADAALQGTDEEAAPVTSGPYTNGQMIRVGDNIKVKDGEKKSTKLTVKYNDTAATINIVKTFVSKDPKCRLEKSEETLGAIYSSDKTVFRIWSPESGNVVVRVDGEDHKMSPAKVACYSNVYEATVDGDLDGKQYQFLVNGAEVRDPYGKMTANDAESNMANVVMNTEAILPAGGEWVTAPNLTNREDAVIYEVHVRDFTIDPTSGVDDDKKGLYLGMVQTGTKYRGVTTGIDHLKELGVTHVQLQPMYDFATCSDESANVATGKANCYNWGYDPWNYNVPETRYSSAFGTADYRTKIQEVKTMVNEFHKNGIRVIMDVVYNHTFNKTMFEKITDKYYLKGDLSGCGNTVNADNNMVWMMIRDSMDYWVSEFHIDGFRLDLVGAFSMKDFSDWGEYLNNAHPDANLLIYGEPWSGGDDKYNEVPNPVRTGTIRQQSANAHVGVFNNRIRNCLKGSSDEGKALGFVFNKVNDGWDGNGTDENDANLNGNKECVFMSVRGGARHRNAAGTDVWTAQGFTDPEQAVSYVTAHDNLALRDKIEMAGITDADEKKKLQTYANAIVLVSQGMSFIHGGEEFGRTKAAAGSSGDSPMWNTYKTTSGANDFKWDLKAGEWKTVNDAYAALIKMRKEHPAFRMTTADDIFANVTLDGQSTEEVVVFDINGAAVNDSWSKIKVVLNSSKNDAAITGVDNMVKVVSGYHVDDGSVEQNSVAVPQALSIWAEIAEIPR